MTKYQTMVARVALVRESSVPEENLERFRSALSELKQTRVAKITLVAGTNGKGTVAKTLEQLLLTQTKSVGLYTSPHMIEPTERIRSFGRDLSEDEFVATFEILEPLIAKYRLSHFEILTLMMAEVFFGTRMRPAVELAVLEVGVGGRLDPTSLFQHQTSVITQLGLDHVELLGGSIESIAAEKLAIVRPGNLVVHAPFPIANLRTFVEASSFPFRVDHSNRDPVWVIKTPWGEAPLALLGARAIANTTIALRVLEEQGFDPSPMLGELAKIDWPCRMERFFIDRKRVYLSGDHNPQGALSLAEIIAEFEYRELFLIVGIGKNKNQDEMLREFSKIPRVRLMLTMTPFRSSELEDYGEWLGRAETSDVNPVRLLGHAINLAGDDDLVVVSGSLYLVGGLRAHLKAT